MTVSQAFHRTVDSLSQLSSDNPQQEARWLLEAIIGKHGELPCNGQAGQLTEDELRRLQSWAARRNSGEPLQYILSTTEFRDITLRVDHRALIPRPETEGLVELALEVIRSLSNPLILDIGTGSGAIALSLLSEHPGAFAIGCDISQEALELAKENGGLLGMTDRIEWTLANLFSPDFQVGLGRRFDLIISNPPYVAYSEYDSLPLTVRSWEPKRALLAGRDGLRAIRRLAVIGKRLLKRRGCLICEIGETQGQAAENIYKACGWDAVVKKDLNGKPRCLVARAA